MFSKLLHLYTQSEVSLIVYHLFHLLHGLKHYPAFACSDESNKLEIEGRTTIYNICH